MSLIRNSKQVKQTIDFTGVESGKIILKEKLKSKK